MLIDPSLSDGKENASPEIERVIKEITKKRSGTWRMGGGLEFSSGIYRINKTIELPSAMGFLMAGKGAVFQPPPRGVLPNGGPWITDRIPMLGTAILWDGPPNEPMIRWSGIGGAFRDFSLWGQVRADNGTTEGTTDGPRAMSGIHVRHCKGMASGHSSIQNVSVADTIDAFTFGESETEGNCADMSMDRVQSYRCDRFMRVRNTFGVNYRIGLGVSVQTPIVFDFEYGGCVDAQYMAVEYIDTFLMTGNQGTGNGSFNFGTIKMDLQQGHKARKDEGEQEDRRQFPKLVHCRENQKILIDFGAIHAPEGLRQWPRTEGKVWDLKDRVQVTANRAAYMPQDAHPNLKYGTVIYQNET